MKNNFILVGEQEPPKDGRLLILLVRVKEEEGEDNWFPTEDSHIFRTIGFNGLAHTGSDFWQIVGWDWQGDEFVDLLQGFEVLAWAPLPKVPSVFEDEYTGDDA